MLSFFPRGVLDETLNFIESVSEDFSSYCYIYDGLSDNFDNRYDCRFSLGGITNLQTIMSITYSLTIALTPVRLHSVSSFRISHSVHKFRNLIPSVKLQPLNLGSTSSINFNGLNNASIFHKCFRIKLSPLKSPVLRKYSNPFKRPDMYPSTS